MEDPITKAIYCIMTVPLGADDPKEYLEMKGAVLHSLDVLVKAGGFQKQLDQAFQFLDQAAREMTKKPS